MKLTMIAFLVVLSFAFAPDALAFAQDWGGLENDWSMPTGTKFEGPRATECVALKSAKQRCRSCEEQKNSSGQPTGKTVCAYVAYNASCNCAYYPWCDGTGDCKYSY